MEPSATRYHGPCCPRFWQSAESLLGHCWATNHTIVQWLRLHTHPKLLAHQCGANVEHKKGVWTNSYAVDGHMEPLATRYHGPCCPRFWQSAESLGNCWATNHTIMQWLKLHTHPKLLAHQCGAHIRCMNQFKCSGWAYGTIGNPLPWPLLSQILTVGWKLG